MSEWISSKLLVNQQTHWDLKTVKSISCSSHGSYILCFYFILQKISIVLPFQSFSYGCIQKILIKLLQPTAPGFVPPLLLVFGLKALLLRHPFQFFPHPLCFLFYLCYFLFSPALNPLPRSIYIKVRLCLIPPNHSDNQNCIALPCSQF